MKEPRQKGDFRPISLGNFSAKIISKILATRLAKIIPKIVDKEQASFVQGRNIATHCALAQELVRDTNRKTPGGNVVFKIDMAKAYDHLEWHFILRAFKAFGFSEVARDLIYRNICNIKYTFAINGELVGNIRSYRGVRQDDLSPLIFALAQQILTSNLKVGRNELCISHLLYADDVLLFTNGTSRSLHNLMNLLTAYEKSSKEQMNFYVGTRAQHRVSTIAAIIGVTHRHFPFMYLGVPVYDGRLRDYLL